LIRVADYIADFVYKQGVKDIFMLSGGGSIYLDDGVACNKNLRSICVRNEATAPMMAEAYARLTGNLGIVYVTTGPGGTNAISGLVEAWVDSAPILIISGQVQRNQTSYNAFAKNINLRTFGTQELNIIKIVESITKYSVMINKPESIRYHLEKAVYFAKNGRPGPVWIDVPLDVQSAIIDETKLEDYEYPRIQKIFQNDIVIDKNVEKFIELLKQSKTPLIVFGQGIRIGKCIENFKKLLELTNIPCISSRLGQDILPFSYKNNLGHGGTQGSRYSGYIMNQSDLIISLGSRLAVPFLGTNLDAFSKDAKVIMVDIDNNELNKPTIKIDLKINSDVNYFIDKLLSKIYNGKVIPDYTKWMNECNYYKEKYPIIGLIHKTNPIDLYYFISRLDVLSKENNIFVSDAGSSYYITGQMLRFEKGQREITSGAFASMGVAISLAIGCNIADSNSQILAVSGDGSLELNIQELKTMSYYYLNIKLFIINNGGYASIRNTQDSLCEGRYIGSDQATHNALLNLKNVATAFDLPYYIIEKYEDIDNKILEVMNKEGPIFIEVVCDNKQQIIKSSKKLL